MPMYYEGDQACLFDLDSCFGKTCPEPFPADYSKAKTSEWSWKKSVELKFPQCMFLDLTPGNGNLWGVSYWEIRSPLLGDASMLNTGVCPRDVRGSSLSQILQVSPPRRYFLSKGACKGILRRAFQRGKKLPKKLKRALEIQAGLIAPDGKPTSLDAFHINHRDEDIDLNSVSGALMATSGVPGRTQQSGSAGERSRNGMDELSASDGSEGYEVCGDAQMQTFVTQPDGPIAFAANQRDEVRDLHDIAGALGAQPGIKQQTFIVDGLVTKGNGDCFLSPDRHTSLTSGGGQAGQGYPCILASFSAGAGASAGGIGYSEEVTPTLKGTPSGNSMPSVLCLNDQGGQIMECSEDISGTLRAHEHGHQPLVFENHGVDSRYTGPHEVSPTLSAKAGTGGNNLPLVEQESVICIMGNAVGREPQNGGNGLGIQEDVMYTLSATDHHAIYNQLRQGEIKNAEIASTQCARQYKDATDLVCGPYQEVIGALTSGDSHGTTNQYVSQDKLIVDMSLLIRRLTPLECERLQGFPDGWTDIPGASDSARYRALGNSVAIPCVEYIMKNIVSVLNA